MSDERDTIPRLHRVVDHVRDQLVGIADGSSTFEAARQRYGATQERLARSGRGRLTAGRVSEVERNWAPTREVLSELIRLGALHPQRLPSARKFLDAHRENRYELTEYGMRLADAARSGKADFVDALTSGLIKAHPYLRRLLLALGTGSIVCPTVGERDIERGRGGQLGTPGWALWAVDQIGEGITAEAAEQILREHLNRRFPDSAPDPPSNKALAEVTNDAFMVMGFRARDLEMDANTIKTLLRWGTDLLLYDQSRYVPAFPDSNVIWLACDIEATEGMPSTRRRGLAAHSDALALEIIRSYRSQAATASTLLTSPYIPIHRVRAQSAYKTKTMRHLVDLVLGRMIDGAYPEFDVVVAAHIGTSQLPVSEPPFRHHQRRRLEMTISPNETATRSGTR